MCMMCNGIGLDDVRFHVHGGVTRRGWAVVAVEEDSLTLGWAYTIGLADRGHPELVVVGKDPGFSKQLLDYLSEAVRDGCSFAAGDRVIVADTFTVGFVAVHEEQHRSELFTMWFDYYEGAPTPALEVLQVVVPDRPYCEAQGHQHPQPLLDTPEKVLEKPR